MVFQNYRKQNSGGRKETNADTQEQTAGMVNKHICVRKINGRLTKITNITNRQNWSVQALNYLYKPYSQNPSWNKTSGYLLSFTDSKV